MPKFVDLLLLIKQHETISIGFLLVMFVVVENPNELKNKEKTQAKANLSFTGAPSGNFKKMMTLINSI
jgi:hypothetical protein